MCDLKIAIVTQFPEDLGAPRGGVEAVSVNLAGALAAFPDLDLHVVTADPGRVALAVTAWKGVTVHHLPRLGRRMLTGAIGPGRRQMHAYIQALGPDVIHAHDVYGLMVRGLPIPRVLTIHGFIYGDTLVSGERWARLRSRIWRRVESAGWADQPHIISISPYVRERLTGIARGVIHDIENPIAEGFFHVPRAERKGTLLSAAHICPRKNTLALIEGFGRAVAAGLDAELRLAGSVVDAGYGRRVEERIRAHRLQRRVTLLGRLSTEAVRAELAMASVFALVSLEENAPMGIEEAMAVGVPVVTSNRCGMPYLVRHGETGFLVDPNDPGDIARRLRQLLQDDLLRARMGETARQVAWERFHPEAVARRTRKVYLEAFESSNVRMYSTLRTKAVDSSNVLKR